MKIIIVLILLCIATTTYAGTTFEQSYKSAKTTAQKLRLTLSELKAKNILIESKEAEIAKLREEARNKQDETIVREQEYIEKIRILTLSNIEKDQEIQRLGKIEVPESTRCTKDYWGIDGKPNRATVSSQTIISYNSEQRTECLAKKR